MVGIVWASPRLNKHSEVDKGKAVTTEPTEEDNNLQALIDEIDAQAKEEEVAFRLPSLPLYLSPWTRTTKILKDVDVAKTMLQSPLLPNDIRFEGLSMACISSIKFEDWYLVDNDKFPKLIKDNLFPQKWLPGVEKAGLLNLKWLPHYYHTTITIFEIRQLLCLIHYGYLLLEEPISITADLIHQITHLSLKGNNPVDIAGTSSKGGLAKTVKAKYHLDKGKRAYVIASIGDRAV